MSMVDLYIRHAIDSVTRVGLRAINLSKVVIKFIGETEKNLMVIFGEADKASGAPLFDEADAFFEKRSEVKDHEILRVLRSLNSQYSGQSGSGTGGKTS